MDLEYRASEGRGRMGRVGRTYRDFPVRAASCPRFPGGSDSEAPRSRSGPVEGRSPHPERERRVLLGSGMEAEKSQDLRGSRNRTREFPRPPAELRTTAQGPG